MERLKDEFDAAVSQPTLADCPELEFLLGLPWTNFLDLDLEELERKVNQEGPARDLIINTFRPLLIRAQHEQKGAPTEGVVKTLRSEDLRFSFRSYRLLFVLDARRSLMVPLRACLCAHTRVRAHTPLIS